MKNEYLAVAPTGEVIIQELSTYRTNWDPGTFVRAGVHWILIHDLGESPRSTVVNQDDLPPNIKLVDLLYPY